MTNISSLKKQLRQEIHQRLQAGEGDVSAPQRVRDLFLSRFSKLPPQMVVAGTLPLPHELDPTPLIEALAAKGHPIALPVTGKKGEAMRFRLYKPIDALEEKPHGLREPLATAPEAQPAVVLCPLLGFDRRGNRLGRGEGYYDATLAALRKGGRVLVVGLAYALQELKDIPSEAHDQRLDAIVTEKEVILPATGHG